MIPFTGSTKYDFRKDLYGNLTYGPLWKQWYDTNGKEGVEPPAEAKKIKQLPGDLGIVLDNLEKSHDWLLKGDVFTPDVIETWIEYKRKNEVDPVRLRPHPWEFALYFDI